MDNGRLANFMGLGSSQAAFYPSFVLPLALPFQVHISPFNGSRISPPLVVGQGIEVVSMVLSLDWFAPSYDWPELLVGLNKLVSVYL